MAKNRALTIYATVYQSDTDSNGVSYYFCLENFIGQNMEQKFSKTPIYIPDNTYINDYENVTLFTVYTDISDYSFSSFTEMIDSAMKEASSDLETLVSRSSTASSYQRNDRYNFSGNAFSVKSLLSRPSSYMLLWDALEADPCDSVSKKPSDFLQTYVRYRLTLLSDEEYDSLVDVWKTNIQSFLQSKYTNVPNLKITYINSPTYGS